MIRTFESGLQLVSLKFESTVNHYFVCFIEGECVTQASGHEREISNVAWLPKSHGCHMFVSTSHDQHAHIWKYVEESQEISCEVICKGHSRIIEALGVSSDGERVS